MQCRHCLLNRTTGLHLPRKGESSPGRQAGARLGFVCVECVETMVQSHRYFSGDALHVGGLIEYTGYSTTDVFNGLARLIESGDTDLDEARWRAMYRLYSWVDVSFDGWWPAFVRTLERVSVTAS